MIVLDTSGLLAAFDAGEPKHRAAAAAIRGARPPLLLSPLVLAELDYLLLSRLGSHAEMVFLEDVARGAYTLEPFGAADVAAASNILRRYHDLNIGLADASIVVLANRHRCADILTLDEAHFRVLSNAGGEPFRLLPADAG